MGSDAPIGASDLGRRVTEQRERSGLSRADVADRAGMSPEYLTYLETTPAPNPTQATLTRLAAALDVSREDLSGAAVSLPPGQRAAAKNPVLEDLTTKECLTYVAGGGVGRFLFVDPDRGPMAIPVNYRMEGDDVVFRTASDSIVADAVHQHHVSFDVDHLDDALSEGWSVLISGHASIITDAAGLKRARALGIDPWAGGGLDTYVRLVPSQISGRRIRVTG